MVRLLRPLLVDEFDATPRNDLIVAAAPPERHQRRPTRMGLESKDNVHIRFGPLPWRTSLRDYALLTTRGDPGVSTRKRNAKKFVESRSDGETPRRREFMT